MLHVCDVAQMHFAKVGFRVYSPPKVDRVILGLYRENGKENGNYKDYRDYVGFIL